MPIYEVRDDEVQGEGDEDHVERDGVRDELEEDTRENDAKIGEEDDEGK